MQEAAIREAKNTLTKLVRQAEQGHPVRLTRRGKPVAVLLSDGEYQRLRASRGPKQDFMKFVKEWRREMIAKRVPFVSNDEVRTWRDRRTDPGRRPVSLKP